ncbi:hypothetical protein [Magnetospira sp. QH-2]|uniref:hypothetical protein n=1 Tax=Magnetospira sp. (strain QH-2) TaxID=1288970 RepID=UPI00130EF851|nr:hypothetical protein [Magnetospira sp. QH-2]
MTQFADDELSPDQLNSLSTASGPDCDAEAMTIGTDNTKAVAELDPACTDILEK